MGAYNTDDNVVGSILVSLYLWNLTSAEHACKVLVLGVRDLGISAWDSGLGLRDADLGFRIAV